jgi:hypothetical protein
VSNHYNRNEKGWWGREKREREREKEKMVSILTL